MAQLGWFHRTLWLNKTLNCQFCCWLVPIKVSFSKIERIQIHICSNPVIQFLPVTHNHCQISAVMIPPTRPNITRLSDRSVMVRWSVPPNDGLKIQFFKVQYRELGARGRGSRWMTSNEDIASHIRSYEVDNLETDHTYRCVWQI